MWNTHGQKELCSTSGQVSVIALNQTSSASSFRGRKLLFHETAGRFLIQKMRKASIPRPKTFTHLGGLAEWLSKAL
jgi:hypothetical protein